MTKYKQYLTRIGTTILGIGSIVGMSTVVSNEQLNSQTNSVSDASAKLKTITADTTSLN
jgi:hypothetical protein